MTKCSVATRSAPAPNPAVLLEKNIQSIRGRMFVRVGIGDKDPHLANSQATHEFLDRLKIQHEYVVVPRVAHNPERLYQTMGDGGFAFYQRAFASK